MQKVPREEPAGKSRTCASKGGVYGSSDTPASLRGELNSIIPIWKGPVLRRKPRETPSVTVSTSLPLVFPSICPLSTKTTDPAASARHLNETSEISETFEISGRSSPRDRLPEDCDTRETSPRINARKMGYERAPCTVCTTNSVFLSLFSPFLRFFIPGTSSVPTVFRRLVRVNVRAAVISINSRSRSCFLVCVVVHFGLGLSRSRLDLGF